MARNFPDFLEAYLSYARNQYAPERFTRWTGLSLIAGAIERKIGLREGNFVNYPNLFVLLVSGPGIGKSSAIRQGVPLLYGVQEGNCNFKLHEGVTTAAGLREMMTVNDSVPGTTDLYTSIYLIGREGSDSPLKNHGDDFRSMACSMYDCEDRYQFRLKDKAFDIIAPVMNMLVGTTFDFLGSVVDHVSVFGGLASRFTYVIEKDTTIKGDFFGDVTVIGEQEAAVKETGNPVMKQKLAEDLQDIHRLYGHMRVHREVVPKVKKWNDLFLSEFNSMESERMRSLLIRKKTLAKKLLILISVSEGNSLEITPDHVDRALTMVDEVTKDNPYVLAQSAIADVNSQRGTTQFLAQTVKKFGGTMKKQSLVSIALYHGNDVERITKTFDAMLGAGWFSYDASNGTVNLIKDPDRYL